MISGRLDSVVRLDLKPLLPNKMIHIQFWLFLFSFDFFVPSIMPDK